MRGTASWMLCAGLLASPLPAPAAAGLTTAPDVEMTDIGGHKTRINYKSAKLTLINFWATWCGPCREEMPMIAKLFHEHGAKGFQVVGIAVESGGPEEVRTFLDKNRQFGINYEILLGDDNALSRFGDIEIVPTTFLFDSGGRLLKAWTGVTSNFREKLSGEIVKHLAAAAAATATPPAGKPAVKPAEKP